MSHDPTQLANLIVNTDIKRGHYERSGVKFDISDPQSYKAEHVSKVEYTIRLLMERNEWMCVYGLIVRWGLEEHVNALAVGSLRHYAPGTVQACVELVDTQLANGKEIRRPLSMLISLLHACQNNRTWGKDKHFIDTRIDFYRKIYI